MSKPAVKRMLRRNLGEETMTVRTRLLCLLFLASPIALADEACHSGPVTRDMLLAAHDAIFVGRLIETREAHVHDIFVFELLRSWQGVHDNPVRVQSRFSSRRIDPDFRAGEIYLVFAQGEPDAYALELDDCRPSLPLAEAQPDILLLEADE